MASSAIKVSLVLFFFGFLLEGCRGLALAGYDFSAGTSTGSTTSGDSPTTGTTGGSLACAASESNLQNTQAYLPGDGASLTASADLNGDGLLDLIVAGTGMVNGTEPVLVLFGLSDGGLSSPIVYPEYSVDLGLLIAADVNGDGQPDLLYPRWAPSGASQFGGGSSAEINVLLDSDGELTQGPWIIAGAAGAIVNLAVGDLNQDGIPDIVDGESGPSAYVVNVFLGKGDGHFSAAVPLASLPQQVQYGWPGTLFLTDLNQDGFPDIVAAAYGTTQLGVLLHEADGGYQPTLYSFSSPLTATQLPRKGAAPDLLVGYGESVQLLTNAGDGSFSNGPKFSLPNRAHWFATANFNADCVLDVAVGGDGCGSDDGVSVLLGDGDGGFEPAVSLGRVAAGPLTVLGPVSSPRALAADIECGASFDVLVFGDASRH